MLADFTINFMGCELCFVTLGQQGVRARRVWWDKAAAGLFWYV